MKDVMEGKLTEPDDRAQVAKYITACILCNSVKNLVMIPHRNDADKLVG